MTHTEFDRRIRVLVKRWFSDKWNSAGVQNVEEYMGLRETLHKLVGKYYFTESIQTLVCEPYKSTIFIVKSIPISSIDMINANLIFAFITKEIKNQAKMNNKK